MQLNSTSVQIISQNKIFTEGEMSVHFSTASYPASCTYLNPLCTLKCLKGGCELPWYEGGISAETHFMLREKFRSLSPD
jgi:hypothetical protein